AVRARGAAPRVLFAGQGRRPGAGRHGLRRRGRRRRRRRLDAGDGDLPAAARAARPPPGVLVLRPQLLPALAGKHDGHEGVLTEARGAHGGRLTASPPLMVTAARIVSAGVALGRRRVVRSASTTWKSPPDGPPSFGSGPPGSKGR